MPFTGSPKVLRRFVALELKRLRQANKIKREAVAERLGCTPVNVTHMETMTVVPTFGNLALMLEMYGVPERVEAFRTLVTAVKKGTDWWVDQFDGAAPEWFDLLLGMESMATQIHGYDAVLVPGLFQTPEYAKALMDIGEPMLEESEISRQVDLRMARADVLTRRPNPPNVWAVLDEAVLLRRVGSEKVMHQQIEHLLKLTDIPTVTIQLLPLSTGMHVGMDGTFKILDFPAEMVGDPGVVYTQARDGGSYHEKPESIVRYRDTLTRLQVQALNPDNTLHQLYIHTGRWSEDT